MYLLCWNMFLTKFHQEPKLLSVCAFLYDACLYIDERVCVYVHTCMHCCIYIMLWKTIFVGVAEDKVQKSVYLSSYKKSIDESIGQKDSIRYHQGGPDISLMCDWTEVRPWLVRIVANPEVWVNPGVWVKWFAGDSWYLYCLFILAHLMGAKFKSCKLVPIAI